MADQRLTLRSYRLAFEMERRIFRVDRYRIPVPYGLPLRGLLYWLILVVALAVGSGLPVCGTLLGVLPWPLRFVLLPGAGAYLLCRPRPDGRLAHEALAAHLAFRLAPKRLVAWAPAPARTAAVEAWSVPVVADEHGPTYEPGEVTGPATVLLGRAARATLAPRRVTVEPLGDRPLLRPRRVELRAGERMVIACARR